MLTTLLRGWGLNRIERGKKLRQENETNKGSGKIFQGREGNHKYKKFTNICQKYAVESTTKRFDVSKSGKVERSIQ